MILETKVQVILYEDDEGDLERKFVSSKDRITLKQAQKILTDEGLLFNSILQVRKENIQLDIPDEQLNELITVTS